MEKGKKRMWDSSSRERGSPLRGNKMVEKQKMLNYFTNLPKNDPVCLQLGRTESHCSEVFLSGQCLAADLPGLIYEDEMGAYFFSTSPLSLRIC